MTYKEAFTRMKRLYNDFDGRLDDATAMSMALRALNREAHKPHGEWKSVMECSYCKGIVPVGLNYYFCPHCGADMRGKADEDNLHNTNETTES